MDTHTPDDVMEERLRAAGDRLRATAPSTTQVALADLRAHRGEARRLWWVLPTTGLVAAAAATIGVLAVTSGQDEAVRQSPAAPPPGTAVAPTVPVSPPPTALESAPATAPPPVEPPVFAGDPPLSASAALFGCPGTLGDIAAAIEPAADDLAEGETNPMSDTATLTALVCSGDEADALSGDEVISFHQADGGRWREVARMPAESCGEPCRDDMLPIPPGSLLIRDFGDLDPVDVTGEVRRHAELIEVAEPEQIARALGARLAAGEEPALTVGTEVVDGANIFVVTLSGLADDSIGAVTYVVWYDPSPPVPTVERAFLISHCSRGVAVDDAGEPMGLCL
jgi:hypothetical protein